MLNYISYLNARRLEKNKKWKPAFEAYKKIAKDPKNTPAKLAYRIGFVAEKSQDWKSAEAWLTKAVKGQPDKAQWLYRLALAQEKSKKYAAAIGSYNKALKINPEKADWIYRSGLCHELLKKYPAAQACYEAALEKQPASAEWQYRLGKVLWLSGQSASAEAPLRKAMELEPENALYAHELSVAIRKQGRTWQEVEALEHTLALDAGKAQWQFEQGEAQDKMNRFGEAGAAFREANRLKPGNAIWHYREGYAWEKADERKLADSAYTTARACDKDLKAKLFGIGAFHQHRGLWPQAAAAYENEARVQPFNGELLYRLGLAHDRCYRWEKAADCYKQALVIEPNKPDWHYRLGFVLERQGLLKQAAQAYEYAATTRATHTPYWFYRLGYVLAGAGDYEKACAAFLHTRTEAELTHEQASLPEAQTSLSNDYLESLKENLRSLQKSGNALLSKDQAVAFYKLGNQAERLQMWEEAAQAYQAAIERSSNHHGYWYFRLGYVLMKLGRVSDAALIFCETRIFKRAHGVDMSLYEKDTGLMQVMEYTEYLETLPVKDNLVMYESYAGSAFSCNPYAIYRSVVDDPSFEGWLHVWVINDLNRIPKEYEGRSNTIFVSRDSQLYLRYLATSGWLINNSTFPSYFIRREEQKYLNTWHGTPLKTLGREMLGRFMEHKNGARNFLQASHLISPNPHTTRVMMDAFDVSNLYSGQFLESGYPRVDLTIEKREERKIELFDLMHVDLSRPLILYAPTWRGTHNNINFDFEKLKYDIDCIVNAGFQVIFRGHSILEDAVRSISSSINIAPAFIDTNELMSVVDVLITDYSSLFFDFCSLNRPIIYYAYDKDDYFSERGVYFPLEDMPGKICENIDDLLILLKNSSEWMKEELVIKKYQNSINKFCLYDDGSATSRVIDFFFHQKYKSIIASNEKKSILMFCGPFMGNGITSSAINLSKLIIENGEKISIVIDPYGVGGGPDRIERMSSLYGTAQIIARVGKTTFSVEEKWVNDQYMAGKLEYSLVVTQLQNLYKREFVRCFGFGKFKAIINFEGYVKFWANLLLNSPAKSKKIIYQHNDLYSEFLLKYPYLKDIFEIYPCHDKVVSVSEALRDENARKISKNFDIDTANFSYAVNPIDVDGVLSKSLLPLDFDIRKWISVGYGPIFLNVGRFSPEKRHDKLIDAFEYACEQGMVARLIIVGDGVLKDEINKKIQKSRFSENIFIAGHRMNPYPIFKAANCFVLSSDHEGQPITLLETLQLGIPAIATDIPSNRSVLSDGLGVLVENDYLSIGNAMIEYTKDGADLSNRFNFKEYQNFAWAQFQNNIV